MNSPGSNLQGGVGENQSEGPTECNSKNGISQKQTLRRRGDPFTAVGQRRLHGVRVGRLRGATRLNRRERRRRLWRIVSEHLARLAPFGHAQRAEVAPFCEQSPDHRAHDLVGPPERHATRNEVVRHVSREQQSGRRPTGPLRVDRRAERPPHALRPGKRRMSLRRRTPPLCLPADPCCTRRAAPSSSRASR